MTFEEIKINTTYSNKRKLDNSGEYINEFMLVLKKDTISCYGMFFASFSNDNLSSNNYKIKGNFLHSSVELEELQYVHESTQIEKRDFIAKWFSKKWKSL